MKKLLPILVFFISFIAVCQDVKRENISGKIVVEGSDIEGITIYNSSSNRGTATNDKGEFTIAVALNDLIEIRALEYQNVDVKISEDILKSKSLSVFLIEEVNRLDEIIIKTKRKKLTGNLELDVDKAKKFSPKSNTIYFGIKSKKVNSLSVDNSTINKNLAVDTQVETLVNGLNIVNVVDQLLIPLFRSEVKDKQAVGVPEVPAKSIKYYLGSNFLVDNFNIPEHRVEEFIRYVEDEEEFDFDLLNYGNELEFLELLSTKSKVFLKTKK